MLKDLMAEVARVSGDKVILFERVENVIKGDDLCLGRPVSYYTSLMKKHGYKLSSTRFINIRTSYYVSGAIRKGLNSKTRKEGESLNMVSELLQKVTLPITGIFDKLLPSDKDLCRIVFERV